MSGLEIHRKHEIHLFRWVILLGCIGLIIAYAYYGVRWFATGELSPLPLPVAAADSRVDETKLSRSAIDSHKVASDEPRYLIIDDFLVKARVQKADLDTRKMFTMPAVLDDVVWYEKSTTPGSKGFGTTVIAGRNTGVTRDGTFSKLKKLRLGDIVKIQRGDGHTIKYEVRDRQEKPLEWVNKVGMSQMVMQSADPTKEGLSLIADSGKWIPSQKEFDSRIIIRAVARP